MDLEEQSRVDTCKGCLAVRRVLLAASCMVVGTVPGAAGAWSESKPLEIFLEGKRAGQLEAEGVVWAEQWGRALVWFFWSRGERERLLGEGH